MIQGDMKDKEERIHPTQKPIHLYKWCLMNYAKTCDRILDTHVGSGSSLIACSDMGYDVVGFEIDEEYFQKSSERLKMAVGQIRIDELTGKPAEQMKFWEDL
jgi:site-specific DNA-methyltransferase (adenine-specific)